jgi:hypothetical protein
MTTLIEDFGLILSDLVVATVRASNEKGNGEFSGMNTEGAYIEVIPEAPENAPSRGPFTD